MQIEKLVPLFVRLAFLAFILVERLRPARPLPRVRGWRVLGVVAFFVTGAVFSSAPLLVRGFVERHRVVDLSGLPLAAGAALAFLALERALLLGLSGEAAALAGMVAVALSMFQHTNIRTPRWLGYVIQRPESHSVHHARGVHAYSYADLLLWDLVFGTFRNPERFEAETGFYDGASRRIGAMLLARDVTQPPGARLSRRAAAA